MLLDNYCSTNLIEDELLDLVTPGTDPTRFTREKKKELSIDRLKKSLYYGAWVACNKQNNERCFAMLENLLRGPLFPNDPNIDNTRWDTLYNGRLYLSIDSDITDPYGGGVKQRVCEWLKNGTRVGTTFECFTYNIADAQGYWFDHCTRGITCTVGHLGILDHPDKHHQQQQRRIYDRSPLALPFLSFTDDTTDPHMRYAAFEADANGNTGYSVDIVVAVPKGMSPRVPQNPLHPYYRFYDRVNGWWMSPKTNEPNLEDNDPIVRLVNDAADV